MNAGCRKALFGLPLLLTSCQPAATGPAQAPQASGSPKAVATTEPTTAKAERKLRQVKMTVPQIAVPWTSIYVAKENGFFAEEGLDVEFVLAVATAGLAALTASDVSFGGAVGSGLDAAITGLPVKTVMVHKAKPSAWMFARPEIASVADLRGKTYGIDGVGTSNYLQTEVILRKHGVEAGEITFVGLNDEYGRLEILKNGHVQASYFSDRGTIAAKNAGFRELLYYGDYVSSSTAGVVVSDAYLKQEPETIKAFLRGALKGLRYFKAKPQETADILAKYQGVSRSDAQTSYGLQAFTFNDSGLIDEAQMRADIDLRSTALKITRQVSPSDLFDFSLMREVVQELDKRGWKP